MPLSVVLHGWWRCLRPHQLLASTMLLIAPAHTTMYCGRWIASVTSLVSPPLTSLCSRVRATAAPISKSATSAWRAARFAGRRHHSPQISKAQVTMGRLKASSATPTTRTTSSRAQLPTICRQDPQLSRHILPQQACGFFAGVHVYLGPHPQRALSLDFLHIQQTGRRLF
jgi:hypothetical protein